METVRKNPYLSGYHWWLFQDYWTTSNGLVDLYFRPKSIPAGEILKFNNDVALLQNGLERTYRGGGKCRIAPVVSNYSPDAVNGNMIWEIRLGDALLTSKKVPIGVAQGGVQSLDAIEIDLPNVGEPTQLTVTAGLTVGERRYGNDWTSRVYPATIGPAALPISLFACKAWIDAFGGAALPIPETGSLPERAVYVTGGISDSRLVDALERGAAVVLLGPLGEVCPTRSVTFGTTWWKAGDSPETNHTGTFVYEHPVVRAIAPDGWCDEGWRDLLDGGGKYMLDAVPARPNIVIRALPSMVRMEESAILFEVGVGKGCLIASGLNHRGALGRPENQWLVKQLVEYAGTQPRPAAVWPASFFKKSKTVR